MRLSLGGSWWFYCFVAWFDGVDFVDLLLNFIVGLAGEAVLKGSFKSQVCATCRRPR